MFETTIQFKPREQWRAGMTPDKLIEELDRVVKVPGLSNVWVPPIRNRIDMLATGIKSPVGVKIAGADLAVVDQLTGQVEAAVKKVPGVSSALAERLTGGRYIDVDVDRAAAARYGLSVADVQSIVSTAIGGDNVGEVVQGRERYPINVRYPREIRDSLERLRTLPFVAVLLLAYWPQLQGSTLGMLYALLSGALTSGVGYFIWYSALPGLSAFQAASVQLSVPILAALAGSLLLAEAISLRLLLAALAVLGGIGNIGGAMLGGLLLGVIESLGAGYIGDLTGGFLGSHYQDVFAFFVLILVLVFRPSGLMGEKVAERA